MGLALLYFHTIRYLKFRQILGRILFKIFKPKPDTSLHPEIRASGLRWMTPIGKPRSLLSPTNFEFLNSTGDIEEIGWDGPQKEKLWRYNQHYFDDLNAKDAEKRTEIHHRLIYDWIDKNPPGSGTGWEPYPTSLRIVNWIKWSLNGNTLPDPFMNSLAVQTRWLARRIEFHLGGNHLITNAKALVFAGFFFDGTEAKKWLDRGRQIIESEFREQILADGAHFELSPMYHAIILEDTLDIINLASAYEEKALAEYQSFISKCRELSSLMLEWLKMMIHPDGDISFFNDAAFGISARYAEILEYSKRLGVPEISRSSDQATTLSESGYARLENKGSVAIIDLAAIGPDYIPGHAHADTLSFELSIFGERILVNSGTSCYGTSSERVRQRGTAAHNTVMINNQDSSEVWSGFRVARRARIISSLMESDPPYSLRAQGSHDGYRRLWGSPTHTRIWELREDRFIVEDRVSGKFRTAEARYHLHPDCKISVLSENSGLIATPAKKEIRWRVFEARTSLVNTTWHPYFGKTIFNKCISLNLINNYAKIEFYW